MKEHLQKLFGFLRELRRRRVYTVAAAYGVGAWLLIEIASVVLDAFEAPGWALRSFIVVAVLGFPVALLVSWIFDFQPGGLVRTPDETDPDPAAGGDQEAAVAERPAFEEAERRLISALFCAFRAPAGEPDPEDLVELIPAFTSKCEKIASLYDGRLVRTVDNDLIVYFGYPRAHEDDAQRAIRTGLGFIGALDKLRAQTGDSGIAVSAGVHSGLVVAEDPQSTTGERDVSIVGGVPGIARWLQGIAAPGTLLISGATNDLARGYFQCEALAQRTPEGRAEPMAVLHVLRESGARTRLEAQAMAGLTPLVGRDSELNLLRDRWAQALDGQGGAILVSGDAGIGKSRLVQALSEEVATDPRAWLTPMTCSAYHENTALYPVIETLETTILQFQSREGPRERLDKLEGFLSQYAHPVEQALPLFASLLSLPRDDRYPALQLGPEMQQHRTMELIVSLLLERAATQPLLFTVEDLHWADPSTLQLLSMIVDHGPLPNMLAVFTARPNFVSPWSRRSNVSQIGLDRLASAEIRALVGAVAGPGKLSDEMLEQVTGEADGVPFYAEELTKAVLEMQAPQAGAAGRVADSASLVIPTTLQETLLARLDQLGPIKPVAQLCATLGRRFSHELLAAVTDQPADELQTALAGLVDAEILYRSGRPPNAAYQFRHALIQEVAYQSLLKSRRGELHRDIARTLEGGFPETVATQPELLAWHFTEAGEAGKAIGYWLKAGQRASSRYANKEAISHLDMALKLLAGEPDSREKSQLELAAHSTLGAAHLAHSGYAADGVRDHFGRAFDLCGELGDTPESLRAMIGLWQFFAVRAEYDRALDLARRIDGMARTRNDPRIRMEGLHALGFTSFYRGEFEVARQCYEDAVALIGEVEDYSSGSPMRIDLRVSILTWFAPPLWHLGRFAEARRSSLESIDLARRLEHPYSVVFALVSAALGHQGADEAGELRAWISEALDASSAKGWHFWEWLSRFFVGWLQIQGQDVEEATGNAGGLEGVALMRAQLDAYRGAGNRTGQTFMLCRLLQAYIMTGDLEGADWAFAEGLRAADSTGERYLEAEFHRLRGELIMQTADPRRAEAQAEFRKAADIARGQGSNALALRAIISLVNSSGDPGDTAAALESLAAVCAKFAPEETSADLDAARELLRQCRSNSSPDPGPG